MRALELGNCETVGHRAHICNPDFYHCILKMSSWLSCSVTINSSLGCYHDRTWDLEQLNCVPGSQSFIFSF